MTKTGGKAHKGVGHRQRLRDKFLELGIDGLSDEEIVEILLFFGTPRGDCKPYARALLKHFKSLPAVLDATPSMLQEIKGVGQKNIFALRFIRGVARRYLQQRIVGKKYIHSAKDVSDYLIHLIRHREQEVFAVVYLDASHAIMDSEILFQGTVAQTAVYPREVVKAALNRNASSIIIAHNHPSGCLEPSQQDKELTERLYLGCSFMQINLLDHLIIGAGDKTWSFADNGLMREISGRCLATLQR